jgi:AraC-like DNA-binding protein
MRLTRARDLLVRGNGTVVSVSRAVGYPSASHFINEFRRRFGLSPRAYCDLSTLRSQLGAQHTVNPT